MPGEDEDTAVNIERKGGHQQTGCNEVNQRAKLPILSHGDLLAAGYVDVLFLIEPSAKGKPPE